MELVKTVANFSAKHEGGEPELEFQCEPSFDVNDYFRSKDEIASSRDCPAATMYFMDKFDALHHTAQALTENGLFSLQPAIYITRFRGNAL